MTEKPIDSAKIYDAFAPQYRDYSEKKANYIRSVDSLIAERFAGKVKTVLDFGAGDGVRGAALAERLGGPRLTQADVSAEMIKRCRDLGRAAEVWDLNVDGWAGRPDRFDLILCLWNVLGHIPTGDDRARTLERLKGLLAPGGTICFDVNNRHNRRYGTFRVAWRRFIDWIQPAPSRGDAVFDWVIGGKSYPARGHLFTKAEVEGLLSRAGLATSDWRAVDYDSGDVSAEVTRGHLIFFTRPSPDRGNPL